MGLSGDRSHWTGEPGQGPLVDLTVGELLRAAVREAPDNEALVVPGSPGTLGTRWTYRALKERVDQFAAGLLALGVAHGQRVAIVAPNVPDWVVVEFAVAEVGAVLVPLNPAFKGGELAHALRLAEVSVCFAWPKGPHESAAELSRVRSALPKLVQVVSLREPRHGAIGLSAFLADGRAVSPGEVKSRAVRVTSDQVAQIQFTSGSTGRPKGAALSHYSIVNNARQSARLWRVGPDDRWCNPLPLFHTAGCVMVALGAVAAGATHIPLAGFDPLLVLQTVESERCTLLSTVPTILTAVIEEQRRRPVDTSRLRLVGTSGAPTPQSLGSACQRELYAPLRVLYGATELSPTVSGTEPDATGDIGWTTAGRPLPGTSVRVVNPETLEIRPLGVPGELQVRGYQVMQEYLGDPSATHEAFCPGGWFRTGDLATLDADGLLRIVGRLKDVIIRGGENLYPAEIEDLLREHHQILDVAVVGVPDNFFGEAVCAAVIVRPGETLDTDGLRSWVRERVSHQKIPKYIHPTDQFPRTGSGKVLKPQLRQEMTEIYRSEESQT